MHTRRTTKYVEETANFTNFPLDVDNDNDLKEPLDEEDLDLNVMDWYQAIAFGANIDRDHRNALEDEEYHLTHDFEAPSALSLTPGAEVPMKITLSEIIVTQKTDEFCQIVIPAIGNDMVFFFEEKDGVLSSQHPEILQLEHIVVA